MVEWAKEKAKKAQKELMEIEDQIKLMLDNNNTGIFTKEDINKLKPLEGIKRKILEQEDAKWRLKSRTICFAKGEMRIQNFFRIMQNIGRISIQYWR